MMLFVEEEEVLEVLEDICLLYDRSQTTVAFSSASYCTLVGRRWPC